MSGFRCFCCQLLSNSGRTGLASSSSLNYWLLQKDPPTFKTLNWSKLCVFLLHELKLHLIHRWNIDLFIFFNIAKLLSKRFNLVMIIRTAALWRKHFYIFKKRLVSTCKYPQHAWCHLTCKNTFVQCRPHVWATSALLSVHARYISTMSKKDEFKVSKREGL